MKHRKKMSLAGKFALSEFIIILLVIGISQIVVGLSFEKKAMYDFYTSAENVLKDFSNSINIFFTAKEDSVKFFCTAESVKSADETIHSFINETGTIQISEYEKSPTELKIRATAQEFSNIDKDTSEVFFRHEMGRLRDEPLTLKIGRLRPEKPPVVQGRHERRRKSRNHERVQNDERHSGRQHRVQRHGFRQQFSRKRGA